MQSFGVASLAFAVFAVVLVVIVNATSEDDDNDGPSSLDNGMGKHIEWHNLDDGLALAKQEGKPLMLIIHKSWCGACKSLKPKFRESKKIAKLSEKFIMVNTMDEDEPSGDIYKPDGGYVPRLLFFDSEGELLEDIVNEGGNPDYKFYYYDELSILTSMEKVAAQYSAASGNDNDNLNVNEDDSSDQNTKDEL